MIFYFSDILGNQLFLCQHERRREVEICLIDYQSVVWSDWFTNSTRDFTVVFITLRLVPIFSSRAIYPMVQRDNNAFDGTALT